VHAPHGLTESPGRDAAAPPPPRAERRLELISVLLLAITTLATAWCGYRPAQRRRRRRARRGLPRSRSRCRAITTKVHGVSDESIDRGTLPIRRARSAGRYCGMYSGPGIARGLVNGRCALHARNAGTNSARNRKELEAGLAEAQAGMAG
jgi:hypothetical protein